MLSQLSRRMGSLYDIELQFFAMVSFFHGKDWEKLRTRLENAKNSEFWINKISKNRERDEEVNKKLLFMGWTVIRFWGDDIRKYTDECVKVIEETILDMKVDEV